MFSCSDWWPCNKPGYITMTRRQSNTQRNGVIATHPSLPQIFQVQKSAGKVVSSIFWDQNRILPIDYLLMDQTMNAAYYSSLLMQLKDVWRENANAAEGHQGGPVLARQCPGSPGTCNPRESDLHCLPLSWSPTLFSGFSTVWLPPVRCTDDTTERSPFFVRIAGHCCCGDVDVRTNLRIFWVACKS
jgi:hypothetical protein